MAKPVYVNGIRVKVLKPYGPREPRVPNMGWLKIFFQAQDVPWRKYWVDSREVSKTVAYWESHCNAVVSYEFMPENAADALSLILAAEKPTLSALGRILA